jgi:transcription termination factor NusB
MSSAVASAKNRRAGIKPTNPLDTPSTTPPSPPVNGLTLPQVIALLDSRLIKLEKYMNEKQDNVTSYSSSSSTNDVITQVYESSSNLNEIIEDFQQKFLLLAEEINLIKDTVLKLQTYTMDVNKSLLEERINILSDLGDNGDRFLLQKEEITETNEEITE